MSIVYQVDGEILPFSIDPVFVMHIIQANIVHPFLPGIYRPGAVSFD